MRFRVVGRSIELNGVSNVVLSLWALSGKATSLAAEHQPWSFQWMSAGSSLGTNS
jgi:hypothetical protein